MAFSSSSSSSTTHFSVPAPPAPAPPLPPLPPPLDLELTIVSAKHLKNINWRNGDLKPYVVFHLDSPPDHHLHHHLHHHPRRLLATSSDDSGSTRPVWNERFTLPLTRPLHDSVLSLEVYHSRPSDTENPLVGSTKFPLSQLVVGDGSGDSGCVRALELLRPSGRPQGKIRIKLAVKERVLPLLPPHPPPPPPPPVALQNYQNASQFHDYYSPLPFSPHPYHYYPSPQPRPMRPLYIPPSPPKPSAPVDFSLASSSASLNSNLPPNYGVTSGPSAPIDYSSSAYDCRPSSRSGGGSGASLSGAMAGLNLEEVKSYEKEKISERESNYGYGDYPFHHDY